MAVISSVQVGGVYRLRTIAKKEEGRRKKEEGRGNNYVLSDIGLHSQQAFFATGKMPVPQQINFLVEQASCLFRIFVILVPIMLSLIFSAI
ncbi:hypothetical protein QT987_28745 [Microcoleus sp. SVA1B4]|uniref:hypothetical protein n=1 Tax=Microcoleus sp. B4-C5 TaxID=2818664 RepID=UPI002FCE77C2